MSERCDDHTLTDASENGGNAGLLSRLVDRYARFRRAMADFRAFLDAAAPVVPPLGLSIVSVAGPCRQAQAAALEARYRKATQRVTRRGWYRVFRARFTLPSYWTFLAGPYPTAEAALRATVSTPEEERSLLRQTGAEHG